MTIYLLYSYRQKHASISDQLCSLSADKDDLQSLTPAHFIIGDSMLTLPTASTQDKSLDAYFLDGQRVLRQF